MNSRTLLAVLVVALVVVPGVTLAAVIGSPSLSGSFTDSTVAPGEETTLDLVVSNAGDLESAGSNPQLNSEVTTARGLTVDVDSGGAPFSITTGRQAVGSLPEGATSPISFGVVVADDADPGTYQVPVRVEYQHTSYISEADGTRRTTDVDRTIRVPVTVEESATLEVVGVESAVRVGSTETLAVTLENTGSIPAEDASVSLTSTTGALAFGQTESASRYVGSWETGERRTVRFDVTATDAAEPQSYGLTLSGEYEGRDGRQRTFREQSIGVTPAPEQSFAVEGIESTLAVGDDGQISGRLVNEANRSVDNVVLQWAGEQRNVDPTETEYALGTLGPGEAADFSFDVEVSSAARSGPRQFALATEYRTSDATRESDQIPIVAEVGPDRDEFALEPISANVSAGGRSTVRFRLANAGSETVTDVSAKLFADSPISVSDSEAYVPALEPGAETTLTFSVTAGGGALEKQYPLSLDFRYEEPDGDTVTSATYREPVTVTRSDGGGSGPLVVGAGALVALVLGAGLYRRYA